MNLEKYRIKNKTRFSNPKHYDGCQNVRNDTILKGETKEKNKKMRITNNMYFFVIRLILQLHMLIIRVHVYRVSYI